MNEKNRDLSPDDVPERDKSHPEGLADLVSSVGDVDEAPTESRRKPTAEIPDRIGPYRVLRPLGEGGMGTVYLAEQKEPIERRVALKVIKAGMDSNAVIARFEAERQALALMDHENIARVVDAGTTSSGQPFFVMEHVKGSPITQYCDSNKLSIDDRLKLFGSVCEAIQHAHQKGIIHRDIKPSNVLVSDSGGQPVAKVIDFGLAKALNQQLTAKTLFTQLGQVVGTPEYMSPEQSEVNALDIDTRTDVYSLGVLLYELLTGSTPHTRDELRGQAFDQMLRTIREKDPQLPSQRLSSLGDSSTQISAARRVLPQKLNSILKGELDWIVMKALAKERGRRYASPSELAADVRRFQSNEVVRARPASLMYRMRKLVGRNFAAVLATAIIAMLLLGGLIAGAVMNRRHNLELQAKNNDLTEQIRLANAVSKFAQEDMLRVSPPGSLQPQLRPDMRLDTFLLESSQRLDDTFRDFPTVLVSMKLAYAEAMLDIEQVDQAFALASKSLALSQRLHGENHPQTSRAHFVLSECASARRDFVEAVRHAEAAFSSYRDASEPDPIQLAATKSMFGFALFRNGDVTRGRALIIEARDFLLKHGDPGASATMKAVVHSVPPLLRDDPGSVVDMLESYLATCEKEVGIDDGRTQVVRHNLAMLYSVKPVDRLADSLKLNQQNLEIRMRLYGPDDSRTLNSRQEISNALSDLKRHAEALKEAQIVYETRLQVLGEDKLQTMDASGNVAKCLHYIYRTKSEPETGAQAVAQYEHTLALFRDSQYADHPSRRGFEGNLNMLKDLIAKNASKTPSGGDEEK